MATQAPEYENPPRVLGRGGRWPDLSDVLQPGEGVAFIDVARVKTSRFPRLSRWFVVVTDRRLICLRKSRRAAREQLHVPLSRVEKVYQRGLMGRKVVVVTSRGRLRINGLNGYSGGQLVGLLLSSIRGQRPSPLTLAAAPGLVALPPAQAAAQEALLARLEDLEAHVDRLTQQVRFLEELMQARKA